MRIFRPFFITIVNEFHRKTSLKQNFRAAVLKYSASVCRYVRYVWLQASTPGSIQCLALLPEPCSRWRAASDVISGHYRNNAQL